MGCFYFDESIFDRASFIIGCFVYSDRPVDGLVSDLLRLLGLTPGVDEFKSSLHMSKHPWIPEARAKLQALVQRECRLGVVVGPRDERSVFGKSALAGLSKLLTLPELGLADHEAFFDQGIVTKRLAAGARADTYLRRCRIYPDEDSRTRAGLQLADMAAHACGNRMLAALGHPEKIVTPSEDEPPMTLSYELWATFRWCLFSQDLQSNHRPLGDAFVDTSEGLFVAPTCPESLRQAALACFGVTYLGCVH